MKTFHSGREAKEFLISELVEEAQQEGVPLTELERKMLYFTESRWTLPDMMQVSEDFDREYDQAKYEQKIAKLVTKADRRIRKSSRDDYDRWWAAIRFLQQEDHYISVMIGIAGLRPRGDQLRLFATGLGIVTCILVWIFLSIKYDIPMPSRGERRDSLPLRVRHRLCHESACHTGREHFAVGIHHPVKPKRGLYALRGFCYTWAGLRNEGSFSSNLTHPQRIARRSRVRGRLYCYLPEQFQQLKTLLGSGDFLALSGSHGGLILQESESFAAEIPILPGWQQVSGTQRLQWLNANGERPFPGSVGKVVDWLKHFEPMDGEQFAYG